MRLFALAFLFLASWATPAAELKAPAEAPIDTNVTVEIIGSVDPKAFVTIVATDASEGAYDKYAYASAARVKVTAPESAGDFEVRLYGPESPYPTLARRPIRIVMPAATLDAPDTQPIGVEFEVRWTGPSASSEYITLVPLDTADGEYAKYAYPRGEGSGSVKLTTPTTAGDYELRYMTGASNKVIARRALRVGDGGASVTFPASVTMGASFQVEWTGPANTRNYLTVVAPDAAPNEYGDYAYTRTPSVKLAAPETPGQYEVRLLSADNTRVLASGPLTVGAATASVDAPATVEAGSHFEARWTGPDNDMDYIAITTVGDPSKYTGYTYTSRGSPLRLQAPKVTGDYEVHYLTGRSNQSLAKRALKVGPASTPGTLRVVAAGSTGDASSGSAAAGAASASGTKAGSAPTVELILDASGSMLQRLGGERRIDIARRALDQLIQKQLPDGTRVALRVFGHRKPDACDTELLSPLAPLDRAALGAIVRKLEAKNLAKTPIAASLAAVADDLAGVEGPALVILVTDGEETCDGDPAAEIARLRKSGIDVSLNIVGFAIDEFALEQEFREWARLGGGGYFAATDAKGLASSIAQASRAVYSVQREGMAVASGVVGGEALPLKPGRYEISSGERRWTAEIKAGEETLLPLD